MRQKFILILIGALFVFMGLLAYYFYNIRLDSGGENEEVFCTMDAKLCPDGSYVGRVAPDCEFAPCPEVSGLSVCKVDEDCVHFGKTGECNCGCYLEKDLPKDSGGECFCQAPTSCKCVEGKCEGVF